MRKQICLFFAAITVSTLGLFGLTGVSAAEEVASGDALSGEAGVVAATTTEAVPIDVVSTGNITEQPVDVAVAMPEYFEFSVAAADPASTYQWQYCAPEDDWSDIPDSSAHAAIFKGLSADGYDGWLFRCVVTDSNGVSEQSAAAKLTVTFDHTYVVVEGKPLLPGGTHACSGGGTVMLSQDGTVLTLDNAQITYSPTRYFENNAALTVVTYGDQGLKVSVKGSNSVTCPATFSETDIGMGFNILPGKANAPLVFESIGAGAALKASGKVNGLAINKAAGNAFIATIESGLSVYAESLLETNAIGETVMNPCGLLSNASDLTIESGAVVETVAHAGAAAYMTGNLTMEKTAKMTCLNDSHDDSLETSNTTGLTVNGILTMQGASLVVDLTDNRAWQGSAALVAISGSITAADEIRSSIVCNVKGTDARFVAGLITTDDFVVDKSDITCTVDMAHENADRAGGYIRALDVGKSFDVRNGSVVKGTAQGNGTVYGVNGNSVDRSDPSKHVGHIKVNDATLIGTANGIGDDSAVFGIFGYEMSVSMSKVGFEVTGNAPHGIGLGMWVQYSDSITHYSEGYQPTRFVLSEKAHIRVPLNYSSISSASIYNEPYYSSIEAVYGRNHLMPASSASIVSYEWPGTWSQLAGSTRYDTMAEIIRKGWTESENAILVTGENFPDALSAAALAGMNDDAPIIMTDPNTLSDQARSLLTSLKVENVIILGSTSSVSQAAEDSVKALGIKTQRVFGSDRCATNLAVYKQTDAWGDTLLIAKSEDFPDALSASSIAYAQHAPIVLTQDGRLTDDMKEALEEDFGHYKAIQLIGSQAVDSETYGWLQDNMQFGTLLHIVGGVDRYDTSALTVELGIDMYGMNTEQIAISTGIKFPDALAASALCGKNGTFVLLMDDTTTGLRGIDRIIYPQREKIIAGSFLGSDETLSSELQAKVIAASKA